MNQTEAINGLHGGELRTYWEASSLDETNAVVTIGCEVSEHVDHGAAVPCIHPLDRRSSEKRGGKFTGIDVCGACGKRWRIEAVSDRKKGEVEQGPDEHHNVTNTKGQK